MITTSCSNFFSSSPSSCIKHLFLLQDLPVPLHHLLPSPPAQSYSDKFWIWTNIGTGVATAQKFAQRQNYQVPKFNKKVKVNAIRLISSKEMLIQNAFQKFANFHWFWCQFFNYIKLGIFNQMYANYNWF